MRLLQILIIPILMITDYALTIWGAVLSRKQYALHFKTKIYELNPMWQKDVEKLKFFSLKHMVAVVIVTGYFLLIALIFPEEYNRIFSLVLGMVTIPFLTIIGRHMSNVLLFSFLILNPGEVEGEVAISKLLTNKTSQYNILPYIFIIGIIYFYTYSDFVLGGVLGCTILFFEHYIWKARYDKK